MTQPELMRQIADAMERNPDGWWCDIQHQDSKGVWFASCSPSDVFDTLCDERAIRPKPRTYRLCIEDMPEPLREPPGMGFVYWLASIGKDAGVLPLTWCGDDNDHERLRAGLCFPDRDSGTAALQRLTKAMGGGA